MFYQSTRPPTFLFFFFFILKKQKKQKQDLDHWCDEENGKWFLTLQALI